jgi:hypothetical protein
MTEQGATALGEALGLYTLVSTGAVLRGGPSLVVLPLYTAPSNARYEQTFSAKARVTRVGRQGLEPCPPD